MIVSIERRMDELDDANRCGLLEWVQDFGIEDRVDDWVDGWVEWRQALDECDESSVDSRKHLIYRKQVVHEIWAVTQDECWKGRTTMFYLVTRSATALKRDRVGRRKREKEGERDRQRQTDRHTQTDKYTQTWSKEMALLAKILSWILQCWFHFCYWRWLAWSRPLDCSFLPTSKNFSLNTADLTLG